MKDISAQVAQAVGSLSEQKRIVGSNLDIINIELIPPDWIDKVSTGVPAWAYP